MGHFAVWTDEQSKALQEFIELEGLSYREAAENINALFGGSFTRSSAVGKGKRMGLVSPAKPAPKFPRRIKRDQAAPRIVKPAPATAPRHVIEMRCAELEPLHLSLLDLEPDQCRWPYSESPHTTFCGHQKLVGSYCLAHFELSVGPGTASERAVA